jgi:hypothetical protein
MSSNRLGMTLEVARQLISLHDEFRDGPNNEWFGSELLGAEQNTYRRILRGGYANGDVQRQLLRRIEELRIQTRSESSSRKFETLCGIVGYPLAERIYNCYVKWAR